MNSKGDAVKSPAHYTSSSATIEPIELLRHAPFCLGNSLKYVIRAGKKDDATQDLRKAMQYIIWANEDNKNDSEHTGIFFSRYGSIMRKFRRLEGVYCLHDIYLLIEQMLSALADKRVDDNDNIDISSAAKAARAAYMREYRKVNKDKARGYAKSYRERRAARLTNDGGK